MVLSNLGETREKVDRQGKEKSKSAPRGEKNTDLVRGMLVGKRKGVIFVGGQFEGTSHLEKQREE